MVLRVILAALAVATVLPAHGEMNFIPLDSTYEVDGSTFPSVKFRDGRTPISYVPPPGWHLVGNAGRALLTPSRATAGDATITAAPKELYRPVTIETLTHYAKVARSLLPPECRDVQFSSMTINPLRICGHSTVECIFEFVLSAQRFRLSCLILPRPQDQLRFILCAAPEHFEAWHREFILSLSSLEGL